MSGMNKETIAILRKLHEVGSSSALAMQAAFPEVPSARKVLSNLKTCGYVESGRCNRNGVEYHCTSDGEKLLRALECKQAALGDMPTPRQGPSFNAPPYKPSPGPVLREGSQRAYALPSRRGDTRVSYEPPMYLGGRVEAVGGYAGQRV